jgi:hypothetical protein
MNPGRLPLQDHRPGGLRLLPLLNNAKNRDRVSQDEEENLLVLQTPRRAPDSRIHLWFPVEFARFS